MNYYTTEDLARRYGVTVDTVRQWGGHLPQPVFMSVWTGEQIAEFENRTQQQLTQISAAIQNAVQ